MSGPYRRWWCPWRPKIPEDLWGGKKGAGPVQYEFEATIGKVGVPDRDNRILVPPKRPDEQRLWARDFPLPVLPLKGRYIRIGRTAQEGPIGKIERLEIRGGELIAWGALYETEVARDHAGALTLHTAWLAVETQATRTDGGVDGPDGLRVYGWRVLGASVIDRPLWGVSPVRLWPVEKTSSDQDR